MKEIKEREKRHCTHGNMVESSASTEGRKADSYKIYFHPCLFRLFLFSFPSSRLSLPRAFLAYLSLLLFLFVDRFSNFQRDQTLFSAHRTTLAPPLSPLSYPCNFHVTDIGKFFVLLEIYNFAAKDFVFSFIPHILTLSFS